MRSSLGNLVVKEIKDLLRDPKILLGMVLMPLLIFPIMGFAINISQTAVEESVKAASIALLDLDGKLAAQNLTTFLENNPYNIKIVEVENSSAEEALKSLKETNITVLLVIPKDFSDKMANGSKGNLRVYAIFKKVSMAETGRMEVADFLLSKYEEDLVRQKVGQAFPDQYETVLDPIDLSYLTVIKGEAFNVDPRALSIVVMSQSIMFPMVIMLLLIFGMQIAATSIAIEKEEKTLETLLTLPVGRLSILTGKLAGSVVVAVAGAVATMVGVNFYLGSIFGGESPVVDLQALGLAPSMGGYLLLGVTIFITIVSALALAVCIAVFTENVRSAQSLIGYLYVPIMVPSIILMFADIDILPTAVQIVLYAIPFTHSILAAKATFIGDYFTVFTSIAYISLFTVAVLYIAAKIFTSERVITGRTSLRRWRLKR